MLNKVRRKMHLDNGLVLLEACEKYHFTNLGYDLSPFSFQPLSPTFSTFDKNLLIYKFASEKLKVYLSLFQPLFQMLHL